MPLHDDPLRLRIMKALTDVLEEITPANGYQYDLSDRRAPGKQNDLMSRAVFRGVGVTGVDYPLPMLTILEVPVPDDPSASQYDNPVQEADWRLLVQGFVEDDPSNPTDPAHRLMADVKKRLGIEKKKNRDFDLLGMGDSVTNLTMGQGVVRPPDELSAKAYFWLDLRLKVVEDTENPYGVA